MLRGAEVTVGVWGAPGDGVSVSVRNPAPPDKSHVPGSGQGLIGLTERATLAGRLEHGLMGGPLVPGVAAVGWGERGRVPAVAWGA